MVKEGSAAAVAAACQGAETVGRTYPTAVAKANASACLHEREHPWARPWHVPFSTVVADWRRLLGVDADAMRTLFGRVAGPVVAEQCLVRGRSGQR